MSVATHAKRNAGLRLRTGAGLYSGDTRDDPRPGGIATPTPCPLCDLFHDVGQHARPAAAFMTPRRCAACPRLRCDDPPLCMFPHRGESIHAYRDRLEG